MCMAGRSRKRVRGADGGGDEEPIHQPGEDCEEVVEHRSKRQKYSGEGWDRGYQAPTPPLSPKEALVAKKKRPSVLDKFEGFAAAVWLVDVVCCPQLCRDMLCYEVWRYYRPKPRILRCPRPRRPIERESETEGALYPSPPNLVLGRKRVFSHQLPPSLPAGYYCHNHVGRAQEERQPIEIESY